MSSIAVSIRETTPKRWMTWIGWILSLGPTYIIVLSATWKLTHNAWYVREFGRIGWSENALPGLAVLQLSFLALYLFPPTSVLGAVLLTGYLGGAVATYVRMGQLYPASLPFTTSVIAWAGIYLRDERLRTLLPFRRRVSRS
jgi:hypothetical protein